MGMFKFSFNQNEEASGDDDAGRGAEEPVVKEKECFIHPLELSPDCDTIKKQPTYQKIFLADDTENLDDVLLNVELTNCNEEWDQNHTDLIPGVYEGGLKVWECTEDLLRHIKAESRLSVEAGGHSFSRVLDLGCGAGLLGIAAAKTFASKHLVFQDYNDKVIQAVTMPNFRANFSEECGLEAMFVSGPWATLTNSLANHRGSFDLILTSETIYNTDHYDHLMEVFDNCLTANGVVWLAAKVHYFEVGGGIRQFEASLEKAGKFEFRTVAKIDDGVKREILEIRRRKEKL